MIGFKNFFNESYTDMALHLSDESALKAVKEIMADNEKEIAKYSEIIDTLVGLSHMVGLIKPTHQNNIIILKNFQKVLRHPKKTKYWKTLLKSVVKSGQLTLANPLVLMPAIMPLISILPLHKQALVASCIKIISTVYFYLSSLAQKDINNPLIKNAISKLKVLLPDIESKNQS